jgi:hypothetical protein
VRHESAKHRSYREELFLATVGVRRRSNGLCEVCGHERLGVIHHRLRRSQGGGNELENLLGLCSRCHDEIHANPAWAYEHGYLVKSGGLTLGQTREITEGKEE